VEVFEIISPIENIEIIAVGSGIRDVERLRKIHESGRWRKLKGRAIVRLEEGFECEAEYNGTKRMASTKGKLKSRNYLNKFMNTKTKFVVCIENKNYPASLEFGKIYRAIEDEKAARHKMIRVIDESREDYLYAENSFVPIELPQLAEDAFMALV
jgi:hypothetical protein